MADTVSRKALVGHTAHTPSGFLVFNKGKVTKDIPASMVARLEADGIIEKSGAKAPADSKRPAGAANQGGTTATGASVTKTNATNAGARAGDAPTN
jgi:hypothetical protein